MFLSIQSIVCILIVIINGLVNRQGPHPLDPAFGTARLSKDILKPFFLTIIAVFYATVATPFRELLACLLVEFLCPFSFVRTIFYAFLEQAGLVHNLTLGE